jgi:hypothetical protein
MAISKQTNSCGKKSNSKFAEPQVFLADGFELQLCFLLIAQAAQELCCTIFV